MAQTNSYHHKQSNKTIKEAISEMTEISSVDKQRKAHLRSLKSRSKYGVSLEMKIVRAIVLFGHSFAAEQR